MPIPVEHERPIAMGPESRRPMTMRLVVLACSLLSLAIVPLSGCRSTTEPPTSDPQVQITDDERITITDHAGRVWDITHAVNEYGFDPEGFQYGLGIGAIPAVFDPRFVEPGDPRFPSPTLNAFVLGAKLANDPRAYAIPAISQYEVINDQFGEAHVSVAY